MEEPDFWDDPERSQEQTKELKSLKDDVAGFSQMTSLYDDIETLIEMGYEENDASLLGSSINSETAMYSLLAIKLKMPLSALPKAVFPVALAPISTISFL